MKKRYSGDAGNYETNEERGDGTGRGPASIKPGHERTWTADDLDLPELPELAAIQVGVDVGQTNDSSAISVAVPETREDGLHQIIRQSFRLPLGASYPKQADRVAEVMQNLGRMSSKLIASGQPGLDPLLVVDAGGIGRGMADLLEERGLEPVRVTVTGGTDLREKDDGSWTVGKATLISSLLILVQSGRLHLPPDVEDADAMIAELRAFKVDVTKSGNETYNARHGQHDDLISSLALATLPGLRPKPPGGWFGIGLVRGGWNR